MESGGLGGPFRPGPVPVPSFLRGPVSSHRIHLGTGPGSSCIDEESPGSPRTLDETLIREDGSWDLKLDYESEGVGTQDLEKKDEPSRTYTETRVGEYPNSRRGVFSTYLRTGT